MYVILKKNGKKKICLNPPPNLRTKTYHLVFLPVMANFMSIWLYYGVPRLNIHEWVCEGVSGWK